MISKLYVIKIELVKVMYFKIKIYLMITKMIRKDNIEQIKLNERNS